MTRRKLYPMPIEGLHDHPEALALPAAAFGMLVRLTIHFWVTECRPLPIADHELRSISRGHAPTWRHWKASILKIFEDIRPDLEAAWRARENRRENLIRLSQRSSAMRKANALRSSMQSSASHFLPVLPKRNQANKAKEIQRPQVFGQPGKRGFVERW